MWKLKSDFECGEYHISVISHFICTSLDINKLELPHNGLSVTFLFLTTLNSSNLANGSIVAHGAISFLYYLTLEMQSSPSNKVILQTRSIAFSKWFLHTFNKVTRLKSLIYKIYIKNPRNLCALIPPSEGKAAACIKSVLIFRNCCKQNFPCHLLSVPRIHII